MKDGGISLLWVVGMVQRHTDLKSSDFVKAAITAIITAMLTTYANQKAADARFDEFRSAMQMQVNEIKSDIKDLRRFHLREQRVH